MLPLKRVLQHTIIAFFTVLADQTRGLVLYGVFFRILISGQSAQLADSLLFEFRSLASDLLSPNRSMNGTPQL